MKHQIQLTLIFTLPLVCCTQLKAQHSTPVSKESPSIVREPQTATPVRAKAPVLTSSEIAQGAILLHLTHTEGGLHLEGRGRNVFEIAGADLVWFPADAHLVNGIVVVSTSLVEQPTVVRYRGPSSSGGALMNGAGRSAVPFQTDK